MYGCLSYAPYWGPGPQRRHMPWLGIEPVTPFVHRQMHNPLSHTSQGKRYYFILNKTHIIWAYRAFLLLLTKLFLLSSKATLTDNVVHLAYDNHLFASFCYTNDNVLGKLFNLRHSLSQELSGLFPYPFYVFFYYSSLISGSFNFS